MKPMFREVRKRVQKIGQPPGTPIYTGKQDNFTPKITVAYYNEQTYQEKTANRLQDCLPQNSADGMLWINVEGLNDIELIEEVATQFNLHPLTVEDILNIEQRSKVEDFEGYIFITTKILLWDAAKKTFSSQQLSIILTKNTVITFQELQTDFFVALRQRLSSLSNQRLRQQSGDYLTYRLLDTVVDRYFEVLEGIGDEIESVEERIISHPTPQNSRTIYRLKRQIMQLRKSVWPMREVISHLLQLDGLITNFTHIYLRDVYDHTVQAMDTLETFRDMLGGLLDVYLSSLTNRMNEVMKVLTIIATIFIPITFIASVYGMNFEYMPELKWHYGYFGVLGLMALVVVWMLIYFKRKQWL